MSKYTLVVTDTGNNIGDLSVESLSLGVLQGSGPKGAGWTGVTYDTNTGKFTFTSNDGLGYTSDDITVGLDAAVAAAQAAQAATEALFDQFGDQYLGPKASDPTTDNDGDPLTQGDIYWNTTDSVLKFYTGAAWVAPEAIATNAAAAALASETAAATSETNAATSASNAATSATNAATSATAATGSATAAASSASAAATSESNAAASASAASTSETNAATSATNAANSATAAATSATNSANSATAAASSASAASTSATNAANSAAASATSASASSTSATNSANSASAAATSATNAATSEINAASSASAAASSATAAAASASAAATSEANINTAIVDTVTKTFVDNLNIDADTLDGQHGSYYTGYTDTAIANLIDTAPATLDTLNELAAALGDDPNFATTVTNSIATKLDASAYTASDVLSKLITVDGAGSALDADTLDGQHATAFAAASHTHTLSEITDAGTAAAADTTDFDPAGTALALAIALG